jgi:hypothetical protein
MSTRKSERSSPMLSVYDGQRCVGFVLARGRSGFEALDAAQRSVGMFEMKDAAISELMKSKTPAG